MLNLNVITASDRAKRQRQFDQEDITGLKRWASKGNMATIILQNKYGFDLDFSNQDWGNEPKGIQ